MKLSAATATVTVKVTEVLSFAINAPVQYPICAQTDSKPVHSWPQRALQITVTKHSYRCDKSQLPDALTVSSIRSTRAWQLVARTDPASAFSGISCQSLSIVRRSRHHSLR